MNAGLRIVHLTDLHFGFHHPELVQPLADAVNATVPAQIVITGDLAHRARDDHFDMVRDFLRRLQAPVMCVPGNHDVPLYNVPGRISQPYAAYRQAVTGPREPIVDLPGARIVGLNSIARLYWRQGRAWPHRISRVVAALQAAPPGALRVVAVHHPFAQPADATKALMIGAAEGLARLAEAGCDMILSGHLHDWAVGPFDDADPGPPGILQLHGGSALCRRATDPVTEFMLIDIAQPLLRVTRHLCPTGDDKFTAEPTLTYRRADGRWLRD